MFFWVGIICVSAAVFGMGFELGNTKTEKQCRAEIDHEIECLLNRANEKKFNGHLK